MASAPAHVAVVGAGFAGLAAARRLSWTGLRVTLLEAQPELGGLASTFTAGGRPLERFYHHWFVSDTAVLGLVHELGLAHRLVVRPTRTAVYHGHRLLRLSTPLDLLRFKPLSLPGRLRLAALMLRVRRIRDWRPLEQVSARDWLLRLGGDEVWRVVWEPLLVGKFGDEAPHVSAVWMWNKLKLRGGSRGRGGEERLAYLQGGFSQIGDAVLAELRRGGGECLAGHPVTAIEPSGGGWALQAGNRRLQVDAVLATPAPAVVAGLVSPWAAADEVARLKRIRYLANLCLVLELDRPLSDTYWLNVNDPGFPFVGVIEHTNFEQAGAYGGRHIVYLSRYLPVTDPLWTMDDSALMDYAWGHLARMLPHIRREWLLRHHVWRARWAQPVMQLGYQALIPPRRSPWPGLYLCNMAQVYPEDRGTNQAVRDGEAVAALIADDLLRRA